MKWKLVFLLGFVAAGQSVYAQEIFELNQVKNSSLVVIDTSGAEVSVSSVLENNDVVVINFWATWCAPCRKEIPHLVNEYEQHHSEGLKIIGFCTESYKNKDKVMAYIKKQNIPYPIYFVPAQVYHLVNSTEVDQTIYLPRLFLFDRRGQLKYRFDKWYGTKSRLEQTQAIHTLLGLK
jgi:thiol-disulfide isomerase/thioredoxin